MKQRSQEENKIINKMADAIWGLGEGCTENDIADRFTREQIKKYGEEARELAGRLARREAA
ncbi:MAG TPA: hypothetical protein DHE23_24055 [Agrobacterium sp.]|nr:hypothetical protein [Agrobacterium sp.]